MAEGSLEKGYMLDPEAKMKSRIDEQSELICILKKRADQLLKESKSAENRVRLMERTNADLVKQIHAERERGKMLETRFAELADNHQEMIKFKDMHKATASRLTNENEALRRENEALMGPLLAERDEQIEKWKLENQSLFERIKQLEEQNESLTVQVIHLKETETRQSLRIDSLLEEIATIKSNQSREKLEHNSTVNLLEAEARQQQATFANERTELLNASADHERIALAKEEELSRLRDECAHHQRRLAAIESEWAGARAKLARDAAYKALTEENEALKAALEEKSRTFDAFTKHSRELIEKERFMNKRLRAYSLQMDKNQEMPK